MKKQILHSICWFAALFACIALWASPVSAKEKEYNLWIAGVQISGNYKIDDLAPLLPAGTVKVEKDGMFALQEDGSGVGFTLTMKGVTIVAPEGKDAILVGEPMILKARGTNSITSSLHSIKSTKGIIRIEDNGILKLKGKLGLAPDGLRIGGGNIDEKIRVELEVDAPAAVVSVVPDATPTFACKDEFIAKANERVFENVITAEDCTIVKPIWTKFVDGHLLDNNGNEVKEIECHPLFTMGSIGGYTITNANMRSINQLPCIKQGEVIFDSELASQTISICLKDAILTAGIDADTYLAIIVVGNNRIEDNNTTEPLIFAPGGVQISGNGSLELNAAKASTLSTNREISVEHTHLVLNTGGKYAIEAENKLVIKNGAKVEATGAEEAIHTKEIQLKNTKFENPKLKPDSDKQTIVDESNNPVKTLTILPTSDTKYYNLAIVNDKLITSQTLKGEEAGKYKYEFKPAENLLMLSGKFKAEGAVVLMNKIPGLKVIFEDETVLEGSIALYAETQFSTAKNTTVTIKHISQDEPSVMVTGGQLTITGAKYKITNSIVAIMQTVCFVKAEVEISGANGPAIVAHDILFVQDKIKEPELKIGEFSLYGFPVLTIFKDGEPAAAATITKDETQSYFQVTPHILSKQPAGKSTLSLSVASNKPWSVTSSEPWVTFEAAKGVAGNATPAKLTIWRNPTTEERKTTLTFTQDETKHEIKVELYQAAGSPVNFKLEPATLSEVPAAGGKPTVKVTSEEEWSLELEPATTDWVTPSVTKGSAGSTDITFDVKESNAVAQRKAKVIFMRGETGLKESIEISQAAPTAVEDVVLASLAVLPNPFSTVLQITNPEGIEAQYELITAMGLVVRSGVFATQEVVLDTESLPSGVYFVRLVTQNGAQKTMKVVK